MENFEESVVMSKTTTEFRHGFKFCLKCILGFAKYKEGASLEKVISLIEANLKLIENDTYWEAK